MPTGPERKEHTMIKCGPIILFESLLDATPVTRPGKLRGRRGSQVKRLVADFIHGRPEKEGFTSIGNFYL